MGAILSAEGVGGLGGAGTLRTPFKMVAGPLQQQQQQWLSRRLVLNVAGDAPRSSLLEERLISPNRHRGSSLRAQDMAWLMLLPLVVLLPVVPLLVPPLLLLPQKLPLAVCDTSRGSPSSNSFHRSRVLSGDSNHLALSLIMIGSARLWRVSWQCRPRSLQRPKSPTS